MLSFFSYLQEDFFSCTFQLNFTENLIIAEKEKYKMHRFIVVRNDGSFAQTLNHEMMKIDQLNRTW